MQTQDASSDLLFKLWPWFEANKQRLIIAAVLVLLVVAAITWHSTQREQNEARAGEELTQLLFSQMPNATVPQLADAFTKVAGKYPGTVAAQRAQLQAATALFNNGQYPEAQAQFQRFLETNPGGGALAASAQLGIATCLESQDKKPEASAAYKKVADSYAGTISAELAKQAVTRLTPKPAAAAPVKS